MVSVLLGKIAIIISRMMGNRGTDVGGRIALKYNKRIFKKLASKIDTIILVTGTNGKSTVTNAVAATFDQLEVRTIDNRTGANMYTGILSAMVENYKFFNSEPIKYAVFEVDEGSIPKVMAEIDNNYLLITNFFRDQLDRYLEIDILIDRIYNSLENKHTKLILNVDDPFCMRFNKYENIGYGLSNTVLPFEKTGISDSKFCPVCGKELIYQHSFYGQLGHYKCSCAFKREEPKYLLSDLNNHYFMVNGVKFSHNLTGAYNSYNLLGAISILKELGINDETIQKGLTSFKSDDGRMQLFKIDNNEIYLNLVKNPAGMNMTLNEVRNLKPKHLSFILNDFDGDGRDVSWIWDADFESIIDLNIERFFVSGTRADDMALRLKNMGIEPNKIVVNNLFDSLIDLIASKDALVFSSYTALNDVKNSLLKKEAN